MALPILAKTITSALVKKSKKAKKESKKKVSPQKLLGAAKDPQKDEGTKVSKKGSALVKTKRFSSSIVPPKVKPKVEMGPEFDMGKLEALLASLVGNTDILKKVSEKDVKDQKKVTKERRLDRKLKAQEKDDKDEKETTKALVRKKPGKLSAPTFLKDIMGMAGRLVLSVGIIELLKFLSDPEKKDGLIQFLTDHMDKIIVGSLGALTIAIGASLLPMFGMLSSFMLMVKPILIALGGILLNPATWALIGAGYAAAKQGLGKDEKDIITQLEEQVGGSDNPYVVFSEENREKLIQKYEDYRKDYKENPLKYPLITARNLTGEVDREIDERIRFLRTGKFGYGEFSVNLGDFSYSTGGQFDFDTGQSSGGFRFGRPDTSTQSAPSVAAGQRYSIENLVQLALSVGFKGENAAIAAAIAMAESKGDPTIDTVKSGLDPQKKREFSIGLWQINMRGRIGEDRRRKFNLKDDAELYDPTTNAQVAYKISGGSNFGAWSTYSKSPYKYKIYLPAALEALQKLSTSSFTRSQQPPMVRPRTQMIPQEDLPALPPTGVDPTYGPAQMYGAPRRGGRRHAGQDFDAGTNDTFYSRIGGEVTLVTEEKNGGYGKYVDIYNAELGVTERIAEGDVTLVKKGDIIQPGTPVQRGTSQTGVFHYEIRKGRAETYGFEGTMDPLKFLESLKTRVEPVRSSPSDSSQNVSYQAPYERTGTQVAMVEVPTPIPAPSISGGNSGGRTSGGSSTDVNTYRDELAIASHFREA